VGAKKEKSIFRVIMAETKGNYDICI